VLQKSGFFFGLPVSDVLKWFLDLIMTPSSQIIPFFRVHLHFFDQFVCSVFTNAHKDFESGSMARIPALLNNFRNILSVFHNSMLPWRSKVDGCPLIFTIFLMVIMRIYLGMGTSRRKSDHFNRIDNSKIRNMALNLSTDLCAFFG